MIHFMPVRVLVQIFSPYIKELEKLLAMWTYRYGSYFEAFPGVLGYESIVSEICYKIAEFRPEDRRMSITAQE